jgi:hypothetical protein
VISIRSRGWRAHPRGIRSSGSGGGFDRVGDVQRLAPAPLRCVGEDRHADVDDLDNPGEDDHGAEDPARDVVPVQLRQHVHLRDPLLPLVPLLEAGQRQHREEAGEADRHQPVHPLGQASAPERTRVHLGDDVVDHPHAQDREGAEQGEMRVCDDEVREVGEPVERLQRLERALDVDEEVEEERGQREAQG